MLRYLLNKTCIFVVTFSLSQSSEVSKGFLKGSALGLHILEIFVYIFTAIALPFKWLTRSQPLSQCLAAVVSTLTISDKNKI